MLNVKGGEDLLGCSLLSASPLCVLAHALLAGSHKWYKSASSVISLGICFLTRDSPVLIFVQ